jgi:hypothetical protein
MSAPRNIISARTLANELGPREVSEHLEVHSGLEGEVELLHAPEEGEPGLAHGALDTGLGPVGDLLGEEDLKEGAVAHLLLTFSFPAEALMDASLGEPSRVVDRILAKEAGYVYVHPQTKDITGPGTALDAFDSTGDRRGEARRPGSRGGRTAYSASGGGRAAEARRVGRDSRSGARRPGQPMLGAQLTPRVERD